MFFTCPSCQCGRTVASGPEVAARFGGDSMDECPSDGSADRRSKRWTPVPPAEPLAGAAPRTPPPPTPGPPGGGGALLRSASPAPPAAESGHRRGSFDLATAASGAQSHPESPRRRPPGKFPLKTHSATRVPNCSPRFLETAAGEFDGLTRVPQAAKSKPPTSTDQTARISRPDQFL